MKPYLVPGIKVLYSKGRFLIDFEGKAFYGTADTGNGNKTNQLMQLNSKLDTIYKFFDGSDLLALECFLEVIPLFQIINLI